MPLVGLAVLGLLGSLVARPLYRQYRESRGKAAGAQAVELFNAGDKAGSVRSLRLALQLAPDDSSVMRTAAAILSTEDVPDALNFWQKIFQKGEGSQNDRLQFAALATRLRRYALASEELARFLQADPKNALALRLNLELREASGDIPGALAVARNLLSLDNNETNRFLLGQTLARASRSSRPDGSVSQEQVGWAEEGAKILLPQAANPGPMQSLAAGVLADTVALQGEAARQVITALEKIEPKQAADLISLAVIQARANPTNTAVIAERLVKDLAKEDLASRLRAADWLSAVGSTRLAATLINPADASTNALAAYLEIDIALRNQNWPRIREALSHTNLVVAPSVTNVLTAALALNEKDQETAEKILRTAIDTANAAIAAEPELLYIAQSAERMGLLRVALAAHEARLVRGAAVMDASENILRLAQLEQARDPQFPGLLKQYAALEARHSAIPKDVGTASQYYYTAAVLGRNLPAAQEGLMLMRQQFPSQPEPILCLAMVLLKTGNVFEATRLIEENPLDSTAVPLRLRPLLVHIMGQIGQKEQARVLAQKLVLTQHFLEERELVQPWLQR